MSKELLQEYFPKVNWEYFSKKKDRGYCIGTLREWEFTYHYRADYGDFSIWLIKPQFLIYTNSHHTNPPKSTALHWHTSLEELLQDAKDKLTIIKETVKEVI
jgi:hypothetical protein